MTLETLHLLRRCLCGQQLHVGDPAFTETAAAVTWALTELDGAILALVEGGADGTASDCNNP